MQDSVELVHLCFKDFLSSISSVSTLNHADIYEDSHRIHYCSGIDYPPCNGVIEKNFLQEPTLEEIDKTLEHFQYKSLPFVWWSSAPVLEKKGFFFGGIMKGVSLDLTQEISSITPTPNLEIKKVSSDEDLRDFSRLLIETMGMQPHTLEQFYAVNKAAMVAEKQIHFLGLVQDVPVSTVSLSLSGSNGGLWNGVTVPEYRRKGILTSLIHHALLESQKRKLQKVMALLMPKGMARGPVEKFGFKEVCDFPFYIHGSASVE